MKPAATLARRLVTVPALIAALAAVSAPELPATAHAAEHFGEGLLWRIDGAGPGPSWLFGTMHVEDPRVNQLPQPVVAALEQSESLTTEVLLDVGQLLAVGTELLLTDGVTLEELIGPDLFAEVATAMEQRGLLPQIAALLKPWAVAVLLSQPRVESGMFLDRKLHDLAQRQGKALYGLETVSEQIGVFDAMSVDNQMVLLEETLAHIDMIPAAIEELTQAYLDRDLSELSRLAEAQFSRSTAHLQLKRELLLERNVKMVGRMRARIGEGGAFIAVGALHLPGTEGLLSLLTQRGYTLTRVY